MGVLSFGICLGAVIVCAARMVRPLRSTLQGDFYHASFLIVCVFVIYALGIVLGTCGWFSRMGFLVAGSVLLIGLRRSIRPAWDECRSMGADVAAGFLQDPILLAPVVVPLLLHILTPIQGGDSLGYHLPSIAEFIHRGATLGYRPETMYDPNAASAYYPRGMEVILAFFYEFPGERLSILAFKFAFLLVVYFLLKGLTSDTFVSTTIFALLCSLYVVQYDLGSLKNDLGLAIAAAYAVVVLTDSRWTSTHSWPVVFALTLLLAIKPNGALYGVILAALWLWRERRHFFRVSGLVLGIIVPFGLYFYWMNLVFKGSPVYPWGVSLLGLQVFPGVSGGMLGTSILANIDRASPAMFLRGLLRTMGPIVPVLLVAAAIIPLRGIFERRRLTRSALIAWGTFLLWSIVYGVTPLSDRNGPLSGPEAVTPHNLLFGGNTIRLGLPAILLAMTILASMVSSYVKGSDRRRRLWLGAVIGMCVVNLLWFDLLAWAVKPESAFASLAPALGMFNNGALALCLAVLWALVLIGCYWRRKLVLSLLVLICIAVYYGRYPDSLAYTSGFKRLGQTSEVFSFLDPDQYADCTVALYSDGYSFFPTIMNDWVFRWADRVTWVETVSEAQSYDVLIVCAAEEWPGRAMLHGAGYHASLAFFNDDAVPEHFDLVYSDALYRVYRHRDGNV